MQNYDKFVSNLFRKDKEPLLHAIMGITGETGELTDALKKHIFYERELDMENVIEELGDIEFYLEALRQQVGVTREQTLVANVNKLNKRYHQGKFTTEQANERADKA